MTKQLQQDEAATEGLRRLVRKQAEKALETLNGNGRMLSDEAVHGARRRLKRMRAELRLLRPALGDRVYRRENARFRDAARPLTTVRDAKVLVDTLDKVATRAAGVDNRAVNKIRRVLQAHYRTVRRDVLSKKATLQPVRASLEAAPKRAKKWSLGDKGWSVLGAGLARVYRSGRKAFATARAEPSDDNLHEWRKQAKYLRYELEVLKPLWPDAMEQMAGQAHDLSDLLGDDHDLAVLREHLQDPDRFPDRATVEVLTAAIDDRRVDLRRQAFSLGERLFAEKARAFAQRLKTYWHSWRAEAKNAAAPQE
jgi:CHAD domain-containing protein